MPGLKDFYDRQYSELSRDAGKEYDHSFYRFLRPFAKTREEVICGLLGGEKFGNVLELGCGQCEIAARKIENFARYTGIDLSAYQLSRAPSALREDPRVTLLESDLNTPFPFANFTFDLAVSASVIQYLFDPCAFLKEIRRVLSDRGILILQTENLAFFLRRLQLLSGRLPTFNRAPGWQGGILHNFTFPAMRRLLRESGFDILAVRCAGISPALRMIWPNLLASDMVLKCRKSSR